MNHPAMILADAMHSLQSLSSAAAKSGMPKSTLGLVELRASQINGRPRRVEAASRHSYDKGVRLTFVETLTHNIGNLPGG